MKVRIKFTKDDSMKFIGHLDIMRYFQKAMRRANIDIAYSEGFSPHQIMSFALPLGVGVTSKGEYLDIRMNSKITTAEGLSRLNSVMACGIEITEFLGLPTDAKKSMALVGGAEYEVTFKEEYNVTISEVDIKKVKNDFLGQDVIEVVKKTKKSEKVTDIKPLIHDLDVLYADGLCTIKMRVSAGSENNLKPELVVEAIFAFLNKEFDKASLNIQRNELFTADFVPLKDLGEVIE